MTDSDAQERVGSPPTMDRHGHFAMRITDVHQRSRLLCEDRGAIAELTTRPYSDPSSTGRLLHACTLASLCSMESPPDGSPTVLSRNYYETFGHELTDLIDEAFCHWEYWACVSFELSQSGAVLQQSERRLKPVHDSLAIARRIREHSGVAPQGPSRKSRNLLRPDALIEIRAPSAAWECKLVPPSALCSQLDSRL